MYIVFLTAIGVGGASVIGAAIGLLLGPTARRYSGAVMAFAGGIMLAAATDGLVLPALEVGGAFAPITVTLGVFAGAAITRTLDGFLPYIRRLVGVPKEMETRSDAKFDRALLLIGAIALHNLPEGIAAGVGFGSGNISEALMIAGGIALQNIPEGAVIIAPLMSLGVSARRAFLCGLVTGIFEVIGTLVGYAAVGIFSSLTSLWLSLAGGTMLCVTVDGMLPEREEGGRGTIYFFLLGFCVMLSAGIFLG